MTDAVNFSPGWVPGSTFQFSSGQASSTIKQATSSSAATAAPLTVQAQDTSASTSVGGKLVLRSGQGTVATGGQQAHGAIELNCGGVEIGQYLTRVGGDTRFTLSASLPYCVFAANASNQFWDFQAVGSGGQVLFDSPSIIFRDSGAAESIRFTTSSTSTATQQWFGTSIPLITQATRGSDLATRTFEIRPQAPFASATGTNRNSGSFQVTIQNPVTGGEFGQIVQRFGDANTQVIRRAGKVSTTDATVTTALAYTVPDNSVVQVEAKVVARNSAGNQHNTYVLRASVKRHSAGAATLISTADQVSVKEEAAAWDAVLDVSSNDVRVRVTGALATNITWFSTLEITLLTV